MYADKITRSMQLTSDETNRRREKQMQYNIEHNITPKAVGKNSKAILTKEEPIEMNHKEYKTSNAGRYAAEERAEYQSTADLEKAMEQAKKMMKECAKRLEFLEAAQYRDEIVKLEAALAKKKG